MKFQFLVSLLLLLALSSCAHDIIEKDAVISPSGGAGVDTAPTDDGGDGKAGNASEGSSELNVVYFAFDSYTLRPEAIETLKKNLDFLHQESGAAIQIEGHCDERGTSEYNLALGERRAEAVRAYLVKQGIPRNRISVISYGKERPAEAGHNERAWAKNRRAVSSILPPQ